VTSGDPVRAAVPSFTAKATLSSPSTIRSDRDLPAEAGLGAVHVQLERKALMRLNGLDQVVGLLKLDCPDDVVGEGAEPGHLGGGARLHLEDATHSLIHAINGTEPFCDSEQAFSSPVHAWREESFPGRLCLDAVDDHGDFLLHVDLEEVQERVVVLVEVSVADGDDEVKEILETGLLARRPVLDPEDLPALGDLEGASSRDDDLHGALHISHF